MRKNISIWILGIAAALASCSSEDTLQMDNNNDKNSVTFTVTVDEGMKTRAYTDDDPVTRCLPCILDESGNVLQTIENVAQGTDAGGNTTFSFTVAGIDSSTPCQLVCWADGGEASGYTLDAQDGQVPQITAPTTTEGLPIAYYGTTGLSTLYDMSPDITLTHAVTKVSLVSTVTVNEGVTDGTGSEIKLSVPSFGSFNLATGCANEDATVSYMIFTSKNEAMADAIIDYLYVIGKGSVPDETATISYDGSNGEVGNLPLTRNKHIKLTGDLTKLNTSVGGFGFTATVNKSWEDEDVDYPAASVDIVSHSIATYAPGQIAFDPGLITKAIGDSKQLIIRGELDATDIEALNTYFKTNKDAGITLNLSEVTGLEEIPEYGFYYSEGLASITLPKTTTVIGNYAFCESGITSIVLPDGLTTIGILVFGQSDLTGITIPSTVTSVDRDAFRQSFSLTTVRWKTSADVPLRCFYQCDALKDIYFYTAEAPGTGEDMFYGIFSDTNHLAIHYAEDAKDAAINTNNYADWQGLSYVENYIE